MSMKWVYTTEQAPGAIPNGTIVEKVKSKLGDGHQDGARAKVVGSWGPYSEDVKRELEANGVEPCDYFYFVAWEDMPGVPVGISGSRVRQLGG